MNDKNVILQVRGLQKNFGELEVLKGLDLDIHEGEVISIIGPSGCGKSTFLRCLNLLEKPDGGSICFEGQEVTGAKTDVTAYRRRALRRTEAAPCHCPGSCTGAAGDSL